MIKIIDIHIQNFMSIGDVHLKFPKGISQLVGYNLDSKEPQASNGAGKSSILLALLQGLFNKNPKLELDTLNNTITGLAYRIIITLTSNNVTFTIDNNRNKNTITIIDGDGTLHTTKIRESLKFIESEILNLTYKEFLSLTYVTSNSLKSIFDLTSSNLLLKLFNLSELDDYVTKLKMSRRDIVRDSSTLKRAKAPTVNLILLESELTTKRELLTRIKNGEPSSDTYYQIEELKGKIKEVKSRLYIIKTGICHTCGQVVSTTEEKDDLLKVLDAYIKKLNSLNSNIETYTEELSKTSNEVNILEAQIVAVNNSLNEGQTDNSKILEEMSDKTIILNSTIKTIESGMVHQIYLNQFLISLNRRLTINTQGNFKVNAHLHQSSIIYDIVTDGIRKDKSQLSDGELTVVSLIILISMYQSLQQLLGVSIDLLILDEAIHATDASNERYISDLLNKMDKNIIVVQHHDEINPVIFKNIIEVVKEKGITSLKGIA